MRNLSCFFLVAVLTLALPGLAAELTPAVTPEMLDVAQCQAFDGQHGLGAASADQLAALLGLQPAGDQPATWSTGKLTGKARYFRIAFTQPVAIGTICTGYAGPQDAKLFLAADTTLVSYLKADAPYPGDVSKDDLWVDLPAGEVKALPLGTQTRALRFTHRVANVNGTEILSTLGPLVLLKERYYNALAIGGCKDVPGTNYKTPESWVGYWNEAKSLAGIAFLPLRAGAAQVEILKPDAALPPVIAPAEEWKRLKDTPGGNGPTLYRLDKQAPSTGIRLTAQGGPNGNFPLVLPLVSLGDVAAPPSLHVPPPPFKFSYNMPMDGFTAININDKDGKHVRRLIAEVPRAKGPITETWDLKDDNGQYVVPGEYHWHSIARPPLKLTYEITVNNAGQPAWWAPAPGKGGGGWMGDHGSPISACAVGDMVFLGDTCAESGHAAIAVDLEGNKLWGEWFVLEGFAGADRITTDGRYAYLCNGNGVQRVDPKDKFATSTVLKFNYTRDVPSAGRWWSPLNGGAAAFGNKLYVSFCAPPIPWLQSSFISDTVDVEKCFPMPRLARGKRGSTQANPSYMESEYDELEKFFAALQTEAMPEVTPSIPRVGIPSSTQAYLGDAPTQGTLAGTLTVAFKSPVAIGSLLLPDNVKVYALKPGQKLPDTEPAEADGPDVLGGGGNDVLGEDPFSEDAWVPLTTTGRAGMPSIAVAPEGGIQTQALRLKANRLPFVLAMSRRFKDVAPLAERVYVEGEATAHAGWQVKRNPQTPMNTANPAVMALLWKEPVSLRGIGLVMPTDATMAVDYWVGPADGDPKAALADETAWKEAGVIEQQTYSGYFVQTATLRTVDFSGNVQTRAVRIRAIAPAGAIGALGAHLAVNKAHIAGFDAIVACSYLGADPQLPPSYSERITEIQLDEKGTGTILRHIPVPKPGNLVFDKAGTLYAVSDGSIVTLPLDDVAKRKVVIPAEKLEKPGGLAFDADGALYVTDWGSQVVKVFDVKTGALLRTIGTPGGPKLGPWDPSRMDNPTGITIDRNGKLWLAENSYQPKRISRWSRDGKIEKWFLGPTGYGGGGYLDSGDKSVLNFDGLKFVIDWKTRTWKLDSRLFRQGMAGSLCASKPDRAVYVDGRRYLVGDAGGGNYDVTNPVAVICRERDGVAVPLAAGGNLAAWGDVDLHPDLKKAFGTLQRQNYGFCWVDKNGDGIPQVDEVQTTTKSPLKASYFSSKIGDDLALNFAGARLRPTGFSADGIPQYALDKLEVLPLMSDSAWSTADGRTFVLGDALLAADGKTKLWEYPDDYTGVQGSHRIGWNRPPGVLVGEHQVVGHFTVGSEELFVTNGNHGDWFAFTGDGLLAACIFGGPGNYGKRSWTMPEWEPGKTDLSDLNVGEEHFWGYVTKANDGNVYAVAGHNHNSVVRVDGLEAMKRLNGPLTVSKADLEKTQSWEIDRATAERLNQEPKVGKVPYIDGGIAIDGSLDDWDPSIFLTILEERNDLGKVTNFAYGALAFDADKLYIAAHASDDSPMMNSAEDLPLLFKHGDALDVQLGVDAKADPTRKGPVAGDLRLLITRINGEPVAMLYRPVAPGAPTEQRMPFKSPVGEIWIDVVKKIDAADIVVKTEERKNDWYIEAAIPWKSLGVEAPRVGSKLRGDIGILQSDQNGMITANRLYWAGKTQNIVSDIPTEARLSPALWGDLYFIEAEKSMLHGPEKDDLLP